MICLIYYISNDYLDILYSKIYIYILGSVYKVQSVYKSNVTFPSDTVYWGFN